MTAIDIHVSIQDEGGRKVYHSTVDHPSLAHWHSRGEYSQEAVVAAAREMIESLASGVTGAVGWEDVVAGKVIVTTA